MITFDDESDKDTEWDWLKKYEIPSLTYIFAVIASRFHTGWTLETIREERVNDVFLFFNSAIDAIKKEKEETDKIRNKNKSSGADSYDPYAGIEDDVAEIDNYNELRKEVNYE